MNKGTYQLLCMIGVLINLAIGSAILWGPSQNQGLSAVSGCFMALWFNFAGFGAKRPSKNMDNPTYGTGLSAVAAVTYGIAAAIVMFYSPPLHAHWFATAMLFVGTAASAVLAGMFQTIGRTQAAVNE